MPYSAFGAEDEPTENEVRLQRQTAKARVGESRYPGVEAVERLILNPWQDGRNITRSKH